ncbi:GPT3 [Auxenochlorella protothecoides x Auxenochlorella symbiontica]
MDPWTYSAPWGHRLLEKVAGGRGFSLKANRFLVLGLTFLCYTSYHASRKPPSIVKAVLHGSGGNPKPTDALAAGFLGRAEDAGGWAPFNDPKQGNALLGALDLSFLAAYAISMFGAGHIGDRVDLRYFLTGGMIGSGTCVILMGAAYFLNIHTLGYFIAVQIVGGLLQATGWPSVVSVMANWFGKGKRGLIMGLWNAHTSVGNILGSLLAAYMLQYGWGWSFIVPGIVIVVMGLVIFSFLVVEPQDIGFLPQSGSVVGSIAASEVDTPRSEASFGSDLGDDARDYLQRHLSVMADRQRGGLVPAHVAAKLAAHHTVRPAPRHGMFGMGSTLVLVDQAREAAEPGAEDELGSLGPRPAKVSAGFWGAWTIPGVTVYALTLFFAKLVAYTFLYWLPYYINAQKVGDRHLTPTEAGQLSILFDVGGVLGGALAGHLSDVTGASAVVSSSFVWLTIPVLWLYRHYGSVSFTVNITLMMVAGFFVNGPYALITTAVSADLGSSLTGNEKVLATVTAIIDGMGSVGAAIGPMVTGYISELPGGFDNVFLMLYGAAACAGLLLMKLLIKESKDLLRARRGTTKDSMPGSTPADLLDYTQIASADDFRYLPPGVSADAHEATIDNETGRVL